MEPTILGLILDTSVLIAAERRGLTVEQLLIEPREKFDDIRIAVSAITVAELIHGLYRAESEQRRARRRAFVDDLKNTVLVLPISDTTAEIIGRVGAEEAAKGNTVPLDDLLIGASALEQGYGVVTGNQRHFEKIPNLSVRRV